MRCLAIADFDALWPYQLSRWTLCAGAIILGLRMGAETWRGIAAFAVAVIFNPIAPIHFEDLSPVIDVLAAVALAAVTPCTRSLYVKATWIRAKNATG